MLTGVLFPLVIAGIDPHHDHKRYFGWMLLLEAGMMGSFLSLDLFLFFVFFEIVLVPMYFLIGGWGYDNRVYAATKFFLFTMVGSAFMLVGIDRHRGAGQAATASATSRSTSSRSPRTPTSRRPPAAGCSSPSPSPSPSRCRCSRCTRGCPTRTPRRRPAARSSSPRVMLKLGTYGLLRFGVYLFPEAARWARPLFLTLAVIGILWGAIAATMQKDLKRLVAYSSVAHLGFIVLGTFAFTVAVDHRRRDADDQPRLSAPARCSSSSA